jgi:hypothetical protein
MLSLQQLSGRKQSRVTLKERTEGIVLSQEMQRKFTSLLCLPTDVFTLEDALPACNGSGIGGLPHARKPTWIP